MDTRQLQITISRLTVYLGVLLCLLLGASTTSAGSPSDQPQAGGMAASSQASCAIDATIVPSPNEVSGEPNSSFFAVSAVSPTDIWVVGTMSLLTNGETDNRALVRHWNGATWVEVPVPASADSVLNDVDAISGNNVWIVGSIGLETLTLRWDGTQFTRVASPNAGNLGSTLYGVDVRAANDVWAVGSSVRVVQPWATRPKNGLAMHWDGTAWTIFPSITGLGEQTIDLNDVSIISASDAWAVGTLTCFAAPPVGTDGGSCADPGYINAMTLHWNGSTWTRVSTGHTGYGYFEQLRAVHAVASNDVWAVGQSSFPSTSNAIHWDGQTWSYISAPALQLRDISGLASNNVWAIGIGSVGSEGDILARWNGQGWSATQLRGGGEGSLAALAALAPNSIYVAGQDYQTGFPRGSVYHWNGSTLTNVHLEPRTPILLDNTLLAVDGSSRTDIWAVGYHALSGSILQRHPSLQHWDGSSWTTSRSIYPWEGAFNDVSVVSSVDAWAVGYASFNFTQNAWAVHWNGTGWQTASMPYFGPSATSVLNGVDSTDSANAWAVGSYLDTSSISSTTRPLALRWNGIHWDNVPPPDLGTGSDARLYDVKVVSPTNVWAVGTFKPDAYTPEQTLTLRWNGVGWARLPSPNLGLTRNFLRTVTGSGPTDIWAAGYYGPPGTGIALFIHWDGVMWAPRAVPLPGSASFILDLEQVAPDEAWAVGNYLAGGAPRTLVQRWDGATWTPVNSPNPSANGSNYLWDVYAPTGDEVWSVGSYANAGGVQQTLTVRMTDSLFSDVPSGSTFYPYISCLVERNIISGYEDCTFRPNNEVTRGQLSKIVSNSAGFNEPVWMQTFEDVRPTHTFYEWVERLAARGYISGYECGGAGEPCISGKPYFRPNANATRGQISKIVSNAAQYFDPPSEQVFEDVPPTHTFYEWIQRLASRTIMSGYPCGGPGEPCVSVKPYFRPQNNATRGQTSKIVANTFFIECQDSGLR